MTSVDDTTLLAYVDGELDDATARAVEAAVRDDPAAQRKLRLLRESTALVRAAVNEPIHGPTPHRLVKALEGSAPEPAARWSRRRWLGAAGVAAMTAAGFAAGFLAAAVDPRMETQRAAGEELVDEILAYHAFYAELPADAPAQRPDRPSMEAWLSRHLRRTVRIPDLSAKGFEFETARLFVSGGQPIAQIVYEPDAGAPVALCISAAGETGTRPFEVMRRRGLTLISWQSAGYLYFVVGAAPEALLRDLSTEISAALQPT